MTAAAALTYSEAKQAAAQHALELARDDGWTIEHYTVRALADRELWQVTIVGTPPGAVLVGTRRALIPMTRP